MSPTQLPALPVPHADLVAHLSKHADKPVTELIEPYRHFEKEIRGLYAQEPNHPALKDPYANVLPLFTKDTPDIKVRARDLTQESTEEKDRYVMALPDDKRRPHDSPAVIQSIKNFQHNFNIFSESSLADLNWDNVVAAGSSVVNCLLPVPDEFNKSKKTLREYYHEKFCPASDVDLFLYGLTEEQALEKIKEIEASIKDSILTETTTVRTKHAITICSQYPTRHIQIVLRIYKSVSEILTGFDIDCSGAAYDGKQVYCTPRALQSYMTQINHIDLSRRSPSYENRLSKYSHRNFEVYWRDLDRSRIDPTIFERSFRRTLGLARLLVLEKLPTSTARDEYLAKRREERGRPAINRDFWPNRINIKEAHEDEIAEWVNEEEVANYHTFTIPYGSKFHAKKIEKLCYTKDLLLNAEWNQPKEREVYLHRHPAFFGRFTDVIEDCCGFCPTPKSEDELKVHEEESKVYVSGRISFITDDPGRQQIGSFNPLKEDDWTEMAYVGNTARLCQAIADCDAEHVEDWLAQEGADPNQRDYTGRTPLHLAVQSSTPEIVRLLVDKGARLIARLADGRTALHLAAARGNAEMIKILLNKSNENEAEESEKEDLRRKLGGTAKSPPVQAEDTKESETDDTKEEEEEDQDNEDDEDYDADSDEEFEGRSATTGSFVKVDKRKRGDEPKHNDVVPEEKEDEPDVYDVNIVAWDTPCSALHLAIVSGHEEVVKVLVQEYGADVLMPVKFLDEEGKPEAAILTLALATTLPVDKAASMAKTLLSIGATSAQADMKGVTAFHRVVQRGASELVDLLWNLDRTGANSSLNHLAWVGYEWSSMALGPLQSAAITGNSRLMLQLLNSGALAQIDFETWLKSAKTGIEKRLAADNQSLYKTTLEQPVILALLSRDPSSAATLVERGADVNTLTCQTHEMLDRGYHHREGHSALDILRDQLKRLREFKFEKEEDSEPKPFNGEEALKGRVPGTWEHWAVSKNVEVAKEAHAAMLRHNQKQPEQAQEEKGVAEKKAVIQQLIKSMEELESNFTKRGAKTFKEMYPDIASKTREPWYNSYHRFSSPNKEYNFKHSFSPVVDMTPARERAYIDLFEATWTGDLERIKKLTLEPWDADKREPPLMVSVQDANGTNLFALAFTRGHYEVAKAILEIARAQYVPPEETQTRFTMDKPDDGYSSCSDSECEDRDDKPRIYSIITDDKFTIENIGEISMQVKSRKKPLDMLLDSSYSTVGFTDGAAPQMVGNGKATLFETVIKQNDLNGLSLLLDLASTLSAQKLAPGDEPGRFVFPEWIFVAAVRSGRVEMLKEIIKRTGAGLPLEAMVKSSGVKMVEKPKTYQGLTVYGKKRKDWAAAGAGRHLTTDSTGTKTAPLLLAAAGGSIDSVEWFLSDAPLRYYLEFADTKAAREDPRLKHLASTAGGFEKAITKWLSNQNELVMHAAIVDGPLGEKGLNMVEYLLKTCPATVTTKSNQGYTPLYLACLMGRIDLVKALIPHSDQTVRGPNWENLVHAILTNYPVAEDLKQMLELLDPELLPGMFKERNDLTADGRTPLHQWLDQSIALEHCQNTYKNADEVESVLRLLLSYSGGAELAMLDGAGDTPLHVLIARSSETKFLRTILDQDASLLHRENAVGRTPGEVATDMFVAARVVKATGSSWSHGWNDLQELILNCQPWEFFGEDAERRRERFNSDPESMGPLCSWQARERWTKRERTGEILEVVREYSARAENKRRLVSLNEANDVARRLGDKYQGGRYYSGKPRGDHEEEGQSLDGQSDEGGEKKNGGDYVSERAGIIKSRAWKKE